ncbi:raffinose synthase Sip1 [Sodiomyces alkalinus F11]|uniref:Raffinose synthase Sip1 n=1 Tax=Sodiomyces alkalinus (strain CBS 110278 / VKM F-3762 / F11) TaxID=1314773 RepID=A0A3N2PYJ1_SODAK|nr:raffinose synthase Sip1 [Sodiomyces alkalinus F11]ROT39552.1 raffinose synthase Sip1 [Sodiomyces alkalinus F11]
MTGSGFNFADPFQVLHILKQNPDPDAVEADMKAIVQSFPPLGQVTQVQEGHLSFLAVLQVPASRGEEPWQVALWQSTDGQEWTESLLHPTSPDSAPKELQSVDASSSRLYFSVSLAARESLQFTLKFRHGENEPWRWTRDELGLGDGLVIVRTGLAAGLPEDLNGIIKDLNPAWTVQQKMSQSPGTRLWVLETPVPAAVGDDSTYRDIPIGIPWGSYLRWFALVRPWTPWLGPRHGKNHFELDRDGILCSFLSPRGHHLVLLAISGANNVTSVFRSQNTEGHGTSRNDGTESEPATVLAAIGDTFESANAAVMYHARTVVQQMKGTKEETEAEIRSIERDIKPEWMENWYDGLGYCTWNGLGQKLTEEKVLNAVDTLAEHNIKVASLIIDDNWQSIDYRGPGQFQHAWVEFEAEPKAFPHGLKGMVSSIREKHPHIQHIAVWHALLGYWAGISPEGKLAQTYKTVDVVRKDAERRHLPLGGKMTVVAQEDVDRFYDDFYRFLASCGVDGVKTDAQFMLDTWVSAAARRDLTAAYLDAWTIASLRHFSIKAISCMSQVPQIIFHAQLRRNRPPVLCRNSDDFFPEVPSSHPWHVWTNAHNALLTQHLNILPDWDMFQTVHGYSGFHAAARCVSGGPIYITDVPGQHDMHLIKEMTGLTPRGKTVIFRPSVVGKSVDVYNSYHDDVLLKVGSYHGHAVTGTPILGIFNVSSRPLLELIPLAVFPGVLPSMRYTVRAHSTGRLTPPLTPSSSSAAPGPGPGPGSSSLAVSLDIRGYDIFTAYPLTTLVREAKGEVLYAANLGLLGKMAGAAAIVSSGLAFETDGRVQLRTSLKALGVLGVYLSALPELTIADDFIATIQGRVIPVHTVSVSAADAHVLEIDVEKAWNEMALHPGWSNEVEITVYFSIDHVES